MRKALQNQINGVRKYKIIGVDDEEGILDSLRVLLENSNYEFIGVTNPVEAIEKVRQEHFDLMLLDFMMTPLHGDEVVEEIITENTSEIQTEPTSSTQLIEYKEIDEPCVALTIIGENRLANVEVFVRRGFKFSFKAFFSTLVLTIMNMFI